jgi:hypothetical protein
MQLNTAVIYFPERNKNIYIYRHMHFMQGECVNIMLSKDNILTLLIARTCSNASSIWIGRLPLGCLHALSIPNATETGIRECGP